MWLNKYFTISELCQSANITQILLSSTLPFMANHLTPCQASWMTSMSVSSRKQSNNKLLTHIQPRRTLSNVQTHRTVGSSLTWSHPMEHNGHLFHVTGVNDHAQWLSSHRRPWHLGVTTGDHLKLKNGPPPRSIDLQTSHRGFVLILEYQLSNVTWSLRKVR